MKRILIFEKMIESIFKFLTEIAICFSKCWKFSLFLYSFKRAFLSFKFFERLFFFELRKKKIMKKRFFHFSHVIIKFFIYNASELYKKKIIRKFFSFHNVQFRCLISLRHFFFRFLKRNIFFFHRFLKSNRFFNIFSFFWNLSSRLTFIITLSCNQILKHLTKKIESHRDCH